MAANMMAFTTRVKECNIILKHLKELEDNLAAQVKSAEAVPVVNLDVDDKIVGVMKEPRLRWDLGNDWKIIQSYIAELRECAKLIIMTPSGDDVAHYSNCMRTCAKELKKGVLAFLRKYFELKSSPDDGIEVIDSNENKAVVVFRLAKKLHLRVEREASTSTSSSLYPVTSIKDDPEGSDGEASEIPSALGKLKEEDQDQSSGIEGPAQVKKQSRPETKGTSSSSKRDHQCQEQDLNGEQREVTRSPRRTGPAIASSTGESPSSSGENVDRNPLVVLLDRVTSEILSNDQEEEMEENIGASVSPSNEKTAGAPTTPKKNSYDDDVGNSGDSGSHEERVDNDGAVIPRRSGRAAKTIKKSDNDSAAGDDGDEEEEGDGDTTTKSVKGAGQNVTKAKLKMRSDRERDQAAKTPQKTVPFAASSDGVTVSASIGKKAMDKKGSNSSKDVNSTGVSISEDDGIAIPKAVTPRKIGGTAKTSKKSLKEIGGSEDEEGDGGSDNEVQARGRKRKAPSDKDDAISRKRANPTSVGEATISSSTVTEPPANSERSRPKTRGISIRLTRCRSSQQMPPSRNFSYPDPLRVEAAQNSQSVESVVAAPMATVAVPTQSSSRGTRTPTKVSGVPQSSCVADTCSNEKARLWVGCSWKDGNKTCKYWVHAQCIGYAKTMTKSDLDNLPDYFCPTHTLP